MIIDTENMTIQQMRDAAKAKIAKAQAAMTIAQAELRAVQEICQHPNSERWVHHDYGGGSSSEFECKDCGKRTST